MNKNLHEGYTLRQFIEEERGRLEEVTILLDIPRTSIYRLYGEPTIKEEIKKKLMAHGMKIEWSAPPKGSNVATKEIAQDEDDISLLKKYVHVLEAKDKVSSEYIEKLKQEITQLKKPLQRGQ